MIDDLILLIDKPEGKTSFDVIRELKKILHKKKIGHSGTLDKFASGLLVVSVGRATKISKYFLESDKRYIAKVKIGVATDTNDFTGNIVKEDDFSTITEDEIYSLKDAFLGEMEQLPPKYSALKIKGKRASDIVRSGGEVNLKKRKIIIKDLKIFDINLDKGEFSIEVLCSKGTYIRALARDMGQYLGTVAHLKSLKRTASGMFLLEDAVSIKELQEFILSDNNKKSQIKKFSYSIGEALFQNGKIVVNEQAKKKVVNGACFIKEDIIAVEKKQGKVYSIFDKDEKIIAIANINYENWAVDYLNVFN